MLRSKSERRCARSFLPCVGERARLGLDCMCMGISRVCMGAGGAGVNVFGDLGWKIPPQGFNWPAPPVYVGDTLNFSYVPYGPTLFHNVWEMHGANAYDNCDFTRATLLGNSSRVFVKLTRPGMAYYACSAMGFHCTMGQKVAFNVL